MKDLIENFNGVRVVGDIHGHSTEFKVIVEDASDKNLFVLSLGDLTDRGPDSPGVLAEMNRLIREKAGAFIVGNHDDKLFRWIIGNKVSVGNGMSKTVDQLNALPDSRKSALLDEFWQNIQDSYLWVNLTLFGKPYFFVHGAYNPGMAGAEIGPKYTDKKKYGGLSSLALYAESNGKTKPNGYPERTYNWTDTVHTDLTVFIGHDYVSDDLIMIRNTNGGCVFLMDTGSGKGGTLSYVDITEHGLGFPSEKTIDIVEGKEELTKFISHGYFTKTGD